MTLHKCFTTLLVSWGSDSPPEAIWAANDFIEHLKTIYPGLEGIVFVEDDMDNQNGAMLDLIKSMNL